MYLYAYMHVYTYIHIVHIRLRIQLHIHVYIHVCSLQLQTRRAQTCQHPVCGPCFCSGERRSPEMMLEAHAENTSRVGRCPLIADDMNI